MVNQKVQERSEKIMSFIVAYKRHYDGQFPTLQAIADGVGINSRATILRYLERFVESGHLNFRDGIYMVPGGKWVLVDEQAPIYSA